LERECNEYYDSTLLQNTTDFAPMEDEDGPKQIIPPYELQMYWMNKSYGYLPWAGGLMDQPHFLMICMNVCAEAQARAEEIKRRILESKKNGKER
jgi:hypothetical protein